MHASEHELEEQENRFPQLSDGVFTAARTQALASGYSVVETGAGGVLCEVFPDGTRRVLRQLESPTPVTLGAKLRLA